MQKTDAVSLAVFNCVSQDFHSQSLLILARLESEPGAADLHWPDVCVLVRFSRRARAGLELSLRVVRVLPPRLPR